MYNADSLIGAIQRQPFRPLVLELSSGERVTVTHPEGVLVTPSDDVVVVSPREDGRSVLRHIGLDHIRSFEDAETRG